MNINCEKKIIHTTVREDNRLQNIIEFEYNHKELEEIVNIVYSNKEICTYYVLDKLAYEGYELISESDIDEIMIWVRQLKLYKKITI